MHLSWIGEVRTIMYVPRFVLFLVFFYIWLIAKPLGTIVIPLWYSAPFWPMICDEDNTFKEFVVDCMDLPPWKNAFIPGKCGGNFGNQDLKFRMLALRLDFDL